MNDFDKGMVVGLALQPLTVAEPVSGDNHENFCGTYAIADGVVSDVGWCRNIDFEGV